MSCFPGTRCSQKNIFFIFFLLVSAITSAGSLIDNGSVELFVNNVAIEKRAFILLDCVATDDNAAEIYQNIGDEGRKILVALAEKYNIYDTSLVNRRILNRNGIIEGSMRESLILLLFNLLNMSESGHPEYNIMAAELSAEMINSQQGKILTKAIWQIVSGLQLNRSF